MKNILNIPLMLFNLAVLVIAGYGLFFVESNSLLFGFSTNTILIFLTVLMMVFEFIAYFIPNTRSYSVFGGQAEGFTLFTLIIKPILVFIIAFIVFVGIGYLFSKFVFHQELLYSLYYFPLISSVVNLIYRSTKFDWGIF